MVLSSSVASKRIALYSRGVAMPASPQDLHQATPGELRERIQAERRGVPFLLFRIDP
jgi:hypothetical protein